MYSSSSGIADDGKNGESIDDTLGCTTERVTVKEFIMDSDLPVTLSDDRDVLHWAEKCIGVDTCLFQRRGLV